jgi:tetratricopeptide (TPR) repeat protein
MPVTRIGPPARVNPEAVVCLTVADGVATVGVMPTGRIEQARIEVSAGGGPTTRSAGVGGPGRVLKEWRRTISPAEVFKDSCPLEGADPGSVWLRVFDAAGREIIAHRYGHYAQGEPLIEPGPRREEPRGETEEDKFDAAVAQIGQGLFAPAAEALTSLASGSAKGIEADGLQYYLGLAEAGLGRPAEAMKHWDAVKTPGELRDAAAVEGAKLLLADGKWQQAIARLDPLAGRRPCHAEAEAYTALALRLMNRPEEARAHVERALQRDPLMLLAAAELAILDEQGFEGSPALRDEERRIEAATAYMAIKQYAPAERLLLPGAGTPSSAIASYLRAHVAELTGNAPEAARLRQEAARASVRGCLPSRLEELAGLEAALRANDKDASAHYLTGLALYGRGRKDEGVAHWRQAGALGHNDALVFRCLGGVIRDQDPAEAVKHFERAAALAPEATEVYADLEYAYMLVGETAKRIDVLERGLARLPEKDELAHRLGVAYFDAGRYDDAVKCYTSHHFHVAEGQRDLHDNYALALAARATTHLSAGRNKEALADLDAALEYPENLGIGRSDRGGANATVQFWRGVVLSNLGRTDDAKKAWQEATGRVRSSRRRGFWSPESGLQAVHSVLALRRLGQDSQADDLTDQIYEGYRRLEAFDAPAGKASAALLNGFLAGAEGRAAQAAKLLDQAQAGSPRIAGYVRLVRAWTGLLAQSGTTRPAGR